MRGYACIAMDNPKYLNNIGSAMRAMHCYGAKLLVVGGNRVRSLGDIATDTFKTVRHVPVIRAKDVLDALPFDCVPVAVDLLPGATPLPGYQHPERAFYIFGAEDQTLGARITDRCRDRVYVPTAQCINLAACINVVLYDRASKRGEWAGASASVA